MPKKLPAGIRQRKDGKLENRFSVNGERYSVYGDTVKDCKDRELELREMIKNGQFVDKRNVTLDRYYQEWKDARKGTIKGNTALNMESRYKNHIGPALGRRKIVDIEKREIVQLQKELAKKLKATTVNTAIVQLKCILNAAKEDGIIVKNPADGVKMLKSEEKRATETYHRALTVEEQTLFMQYAKKEWLYELLALLLCTGMRIGEATALTWADIDHVNQVIHITKTISRTDDGQYIVGSPKSRTSIRDIPINEDIRQILKSQKEKQQMLNGKILKMSRRVFEGFNGTMVYNGVVNKTITRIIQRMRADGIQIEHFSAHALRDTFATRYIEQGGSPQILKTLLGHSSLTMTMDLYSHVLPNRKKEEMDNIKIAF